MNILSYRKHSIVLSFVFGVILSLVIGALLAMTICNQISQMVSIPIMIIALCMIIVSYRTNRFCGCKFWPLHMFLRPFNVVNSIASFWVTSLSATITSFMLVILHNFNNNLLGIISTIFLTVVFFILGLLDNFKSSMPSKDHQIIIEAFENIGTTDTEKRTSNTLIDEMRKTREQLYELMNMP